MGFILHIYIIFGTNLLTGGPTHFVVFCLFQCFEEKEYQTESKWNETFGSMFFWNERDPEDLECKSRGSRSGHQDGGRAHPYSARPLSRGPLGRPPTYFFLLYIPTYPENIRIDHENLIPPPQPSVLMRSHLGAFSGAPPEGALITEGLYINSMAPPMMCEQFTSDLRVHSYQLDGFFSLFGSQYKFLLDLLGDLFNVTLFAVRLSRSDELWVYDQVYP